MRLKKSVVFIIVIFIILIVGIFFVRFVSSQEKDKISEEVYEKLEKGVETRVIIKLKEPAIEKGFLIKTQKTDEEIALEKQEIKEKIINKVREENVKHVFNDYIAVSISEEKLNQLNRNPYIESVIIDKPIHAFLQQSVPMINASTVWPIKLSGINITGIDETICILDTGINFSHPDLIGKNKTCVIDCFNKSCVENCSIADDNGHGTHVAGIVAASSGINGIATGANLIGVKVLNSAGEGSGSDLDAGIDWCIGNKETYNISVISMSLGTDCVGYPQFCYVNYCDASEPTTTPRINNATFLNISVIAATGNNGNTTSISSPACIKNVTAVGWATKADAMDGSGNRNSLVDLVAPGTNINSTFAGGTCSGCQCAGNYMVCSGTSMAAPHVSGAFALVKQFFRLQNSRVPKPKEIENALNSTGKLIYDSASGLNFSRIDVYSALISIDSSNPIVNLISPTNSTTQFNQNVSFQCSANDVKLSNLTLYVWNSTNLINDTGIRALSGTNAIEEFNLTLDYENYKWNCLAYDSKGNSSFAESNYSLTIISLSITLNSPQDNLFTNQNQSFNCSAVSTEQLSNVTFYLWNSTALSYNETKTVTGIGNSTTFQRNFTEEGSYKWNCKFSNNVNLSNLASLNYSILYDTTSPNLNITSPLNNSWHSAGRFNVSLNENGSCQYSLNQRQNISMNSLDSRNFSHINNSLVEGLYNISFYCNDTAGNENSGTISFNVDATLPNVVLVEPFPSSETTNSALKIFYFNVSDNYNITNCSLIINNQINLTNSSISQSETQNFSQTFGIGTYNWQINCTDEAENQGNSTIKSFTLTSLSSTAATPGGGGASSVTYTPTTERITRGYTQELRKQDKVKFTFFDEKAREHTLTLNYIGKDFVNLTIKSSIIKLSLGIGQSAKLNLTSSKFYDLYIKLESIVSNRAKLTIQIIHEEIPKPTTITREAIKEETPKEKENPAEEKERSIIDKIKNISIIVLVLIIIILITIIFSIKKIIKIKQMRKIKKNEKTKTKS